MDTVDVDIKETVRQAQVLSLSEEEKEECAEVLLEFENKTEKMIFNVNRTVRSLRAAAARLDKVWWDCKIAHAAGTSTAIVSGILGIVAAVPSGGTSLPLLLPGIGLGVGGAAINLGTLFVEAAMNYDEIKKAEKLLKETSDSIVAMNTTLQRVLKGKELIKLAYIYYLAESLEMTHVKNFLWMIFQSHSFDFPFEILKNVGMWKDAAKAGMQGTGKAATQVTDDVAGTAGKVVLQSGDDVVQSGTKVGSKTAAKCVGKVLIVANVTFLVVDCVDMFFTIRDLVKEKGSEAAKELRARANELEDFLKKHSVK